MSDETSEEKTPDQQATDPAPEKQAPAEPPEGAAKDVDAEELQQRLKRAQNAESSAKRQLAKLTEDMDKLKTQLGERETDQEKTERLIAEATERAQKAETELVKTKQMSRVVAALAKAGVSHEEPADLVGADDEETDARVARALKMAVAVDKARKTNLLDGNRRVPDDGDDADGLPAPKVFYELSKDKQEALRKKHGDPVPIWASRGDLGPK